MKMIAPKTSLMMSIGIVIGLIASAKGLGYLITFWAGWFLSVAYDRMFTLPGGTWKFQPKEFVSHSEEKNHKR